MKKSNTRYFAVIPAAGLGKRFNIDIAKQYLSINNKTIIAHSLAPFLDDHRIEKVVVVLNKNDQHWPLLKLQHPKLITTLGGKERFHTVLNGLIALKDSAQSTDWILVHDAARPCLRGSDVEKLIHTVADHPVGGLLGIPIQDTVKQVSEVSEVRTLPNPNKQLWRALTPQLFRYGVLQQALVTAVENSFCPTDEASAVEYLGQKPFMVKGRPDNIKITEAEDLALASLYLQNRV